jgi:hypothetical protein
MVRIFANRRVQQPSLRCLVRRLEAAQQLVQGLENLPGEFRRDDVLVFAALLENVRQALLAAQCKEPRRAEEHAERREHVAIEGCTQTVHRPCDVA